MGTYVNTPYDDVFRTLVTDGGSLIIPLINETFHENYDGTEKIILRQNEHYLNSQDGSQDEIITDSNITICGKMKTKDYHFECQSTPDNSMLVRFFEYDSEIALMNAEITGNLMHMRFPYSAVLYLRSLKNTPDELEIIVEYPGEAQNGHYKIPVIKMEDYQLKQIFEKKLWFLIPFYIFNYEKKFEKIDEDAKELSVLKREYEDIKNHLEAQVTDGNIDEYRKCMITDMTRKVLSHLAVKYENVVEGVESAMGGRVLEYEAKTIYNSGKAEGLEAGREEGRAEGCYETLFRLVDGNIITLSQAAEQVGMTEAEFQEKIKRFKKNS